MKGAALIIAPRQARSAHAERRLVDALSGLLRDQPYEQITVPAIARRAGVAVGGVYRRFPGKNRMLLYAANDLWTRTLQPSLTREVARGRWEARHLSTVVHAYLRFVARAFGRYRGLLRAVAMVSRTAADPDMVRLVTGANRHSHATLRRLMLARRSEIRHRQPAVAIDTAILWASAALREVVLFGEPVSHLTRRGSRDAFVHELARGVTAYLCRPTRSARRRG